MNFALRLERSGLPAGLRAVGRALLVASLLIVLGAAAVFFAHDRRVAAERGKLAAAAERAESVAQLGQVGAEEQELARSARLFAELRQRGVVGEGQRFAWADLLAELREKHRLPALHYAISPSLPLARRSDDGNDEAVTSASARADPGFHVSTLQLQARLVHEEDLFRLLDELEQRAQALLQVKRCSLQRLPFAAAAADGAAVQAECEIDCITVHSGERR